MPLIPSLAGFRKIAGSFLSEEVHVKATFAYNACQLILSSAQRYSPEWAGSILKAQRTFIVLDAAFLVLDTWQLYRKIEKERRTKNISKDIFLLLLAAAVSAVGVFVLNQGRLRPAEDLNEILKKIALPEEIKDITLDWEKPWIHALTQWFSLTRFLFQGFTSAARGPERKRYLTNAGLQLFHFLNISRLPFLKYKHVSLRTLSSTDTVRTEKVESSFYFLIAASKDNSYLGTAVQTIHHFCNRILQRLSNTFFLPPQTSISMRLDHNYLPIPNSLCNPAPFYQHLFIKAEGVIEAAQPK